MTKVKNPNSRNVTFAIMLAGALVSGFAQTGTNTALPDIMDDLDISIAYGQWLTNVFPMCLGIVIPLVAYFSRRFDIHRLYLFCVAVFGLSSLVGCIADSFLLLLGVRLLQGTTAGVLLTLIQLVAVTDDNPRRRAVIMGLAGLALGFAPNFGPVVAGLLTTVYGWRSFFTFLFVFSLVVAVLFHLFAKLDIEEGDPGKLDFPSVVLSCVGLGSVILGFSTLAHNPGVGLESTVPFLVGVVSIAVFCRRQFRISNPMLNLHVFSNTTFTLGTIMLGALYVNFIGTNFLIPMHNQETLGVSALDSGLVMFPGALTAALGCILSGPCVNRFGMRRTVVTGSAFLVASSIPLLFIGQVDSLVYIGFFRALRALGINIIMMPITDWSMRGLADEVIPDATSLSTTVRQVCGVLGTTVMVFVMTAGGTSATIIPAWEDAAMIFSFLFVVAILLMAVFAKSRPGGR